MQSPITKVIRIALFVVALAVVAGAPASAQDVTCNASNSTISVGEVAGVLIVDFPSGTCTVNNGVVLPEGVEVMNGTLDITGIASNGIVVFGDITAEPGTAIVMNQTKVFGKISAEQATALTVMNSKVGDGLESKQGGPVNISSSYLGGIKSEQDARITATNNQLGDKVEVKEVAGPVNLSGNTGGEVIVEKSSGTVSITSNTAFSTIKVVGNTGASTTVTGNTTPKLECSSNTNLSQSGNIALENLCTN